MKTTKRQEPDVSDRKDTFNEDEFHTTDEIPYGQSPLQQPDPPSFKVMKKQVGKKKASMKSKWLNPKPTEKASPSPEKPTLKEGWDFYLKQIGKERFTPAPRNNGFDKYFGAK